tara:strand:+ start:229 stop:510 length:282 start_codon:yes stop_codon:yes gene_type:complete
MLMGQLLTKRIKMQGFIIFDDYGHRYDEFAQEGFGNWVIGTDDSAFLLGGENVAFNVTQTGNDNIVEGAVIGFNSTVSVTQLGDGNTTTITQM